MNLHKALKEVLPWAKPHYVYRAKAKKLAELAESYMENHSPDVGKNLKRASKAIKEG